MKFRSDSIIRFLYVPLGFKPEGFTHAFKAMMKGHIPFVRHSPTCTPSPEEDVYALTDDGALLKVVAGKIDFPYLEANKSDWEGRN